MLEKIPAGRGQALSGVRAGAAKTIGEDEAFTGIAEIVAEMKGHVAAKGILVGTYERE